MQLRAEEAHVDRLHDEDRGDDARAEQRGRRPGGQQPLLRQTEGHGGGEAHDGDCVDEEVDGVAQDDAVIEAAELEHREELSEGT